MKWRVELPGKGHGSPIVVGDRIFLNTCLEKESRRVLICLDRKSGKTLWQKVVLDSPLERKNDLNSHASSTPCSDGQRVYVSFLDISFPLDVPDSPPKWSKGSGRMAGKALLACYDLDGREVWRKHLGRFSSVHGFSCSPIIHKETVILNCDHDGDGYIVCLDKLTGEQRWKIDRPNKTRSYCNPTIFTAGGKTQMVLSGSKCTASYDPQTGKQNWLLDGPTEQFVASMILADDVFMITGGFPQFHTLGIAPDGTKLWHEKGKSVAAYVPSPVAFEKWFFLVTDDGRALCLEAKTGRTQWSEQLGRHHRPSAVLGGGNIYWLSDAGECFVVKASDKFQLLARNELHEPCNATPIISGRAIYIRTDNVLWCIGQ